MDVFSWERVSGFRKIVFPLPTILTSFRYQACPSLNIIIIRALLHSRARHFNTPHVTDGKDRKNFFRNRESPFWKLSQQHVLCHGSNNKRRNVVLDFWGGKEDSWIIRKLEFLNKLVFLGARLITIFYSSPSFSVILFWNTKSWEFQV